MARDISGCARAAIWWSGSSETGVMTMWMRNAMCAALVVGTWLSAPTKAQEMPPATAAPKSHRMPMMSKLSYRCGGDAKVIVFLRERNARVVFAGKSYSVKQVESASGTKYSDGTTAWWSKGDEGFLEEEAKEGQPVRLADNCKLQKAANAASAGIVRGTAAYRERIAMPENAVLTMQLQDV